MISRRFLKTVSWALLFSGISPAFAAGDASYQYSAERKEENLRRYGLFHSYAEVMAEEPEAVAGHSEAARLEKNMRLYEKKIARISGAALMDVSAAAPEDAPFVPDPAEMRGLRLFLEKNVSDTGMPLSFRASAEYWKNLDDKLGIVEAVLERTLVANALNIYDGALWQIALVISSPDGGAALADGQTARLSEGSAGDIQNLRGYGPSFLYGDEEKMMDRDNGYFFRMISDRYVQDDPLGQNDVAGFPNFSRVHHEDWKPVTGEQAWAAVIGPLQVAYRKYGGKIPADASEVRLAKSVLTALSAMQSPVGAFYHAPKGTYGIHPKLISNENNLSVYAALRMLEAVLPSGDPDLPGVTGMREKLEDYLSRYAYDRQAHQFYVGGFYVENRLVPQKLFAVDCQTWAIGALGPEWIDRHFGDGEAYEVWKKTLASAASLDARGRLEGVGFAADHGVVSVEWTCGAILAARLLAGFYGKTHPEWAALLKRQADQLRRGIEKYREDLSGGQTAFLYASERYFIPFGWWANPVPSLSSSAWVLFTDLEFDPFVLGGKTSF